MNTTSEWQVREQAEARGTPTSHAQFQSYVDWGLLSAAPDGRWPAETVDRLIHIRQAELYARPLSRRVIRLRADYLSFPVPTSKVREALIAMVGPRSIRAPRRKLRLINAGLQRWGAKLSTFAGITPAAGYHWAAPPGVPRQWIEPEPSLWGDLLREPRLSHEYFGGLITAQYSFDASLAGRGIDWPTDSVIPQEERILLLIVRELSIDRCRTLMDLLRAVEMYRRSGDLSGQALVKEAGLKSARADEPLLVVLREENWRLTADEWALKDEIRGVVNGIWGPQDVEFVRHLPANVIRRRP